MKSAIGSTMIIVGILCGVWAGIWWAFIGGIVDIFTAAKAEHIVPLDIAIGVAKIVFSAVIGQMSAALLIFPGVAILKA